MLCRNFDLLKSNQYFRFSSSSSWYIFVLVNTRLSSKLPPHFNVLKFLAKRAFRQIFLQPFRPVFTRLSGNFGMYFQTTYYRPVAGAENGLPPPWRAVRWVPLTPIFPHTRTGQAYSTPSLLQGCRAGKMYLGISEAAGETRKKMRYKKMCLFIINRQ